MISTRLVNMVALAAFFMLVFCLQRLWHENDKLKTDITALKHQRDDAYRVVEEVQSNQKRQADLDKHVTERLNASESENNRLRSELTTANRRLRIKAKCPATTTGSMGDDTSVELADTAGHAVLDIRAGIIRDQAKIDYLQQYITSFCYKQ